MEIDTTRSGRWRSTRAWNATQNTATAPPNTVDATPTATGQGATAIAVDAPTIAAAATGSARGPGGRRTSAA